MNTDCILAIDIGAGTQDILLYDPEQSMENAVKLVLPSPTRIAAYRVREVTQRKKSLFLSGHVMGGGAVTRAIQNHIKQGLTVYSLEDPALTMHDNLDYVREMGVRLVETRPESEAIEVTLGDIDIPSLTNALAHFEVPVPEITAIALQDHGYSPQVSNRLSRFSEWRRFLEDGGKIDALLYTDPPPRLTRMATALKARPGAFLMDTGAAALRGAVLDDFAAQHLEDGVIALNAGNSHTVAALVKGDQVWGIYEHHTHMLNPELLGDQIKRFAVAALTHEEVFEQNGHGVAYNPGYSELKPFEHVVVTGPRREVAANLGHPAAPFGEMMLSGCFGLVEAIRKHQKQGI
ncbi:MAG: DUF1786 domain-containing protein [Deltaproteobacteria bacterium]|nr:DUF1786 domain-containing protein [Deltaproteobacteria bacterium]MBW2052223.1 DUF1786 domain-containing protein [Deltaproteobacteria bacterium]MBW2141044.1 DUF1786 domain-containing protein [Deltaproteobacteria bacterium]MBW2323481.1 DUF1786 domain-containing protein [Deltaproteobacteria bacterium]